MSDNWYTDGDAVKADDGLICRTNARSLATQIAREHNAHDALVAACEAADRALRMLDRNSEAIVAGLRGLDGGLAGAAADTLNGIRRSLLHAAPALAKAKEKPTNEK